MEIKTGMKFLCIKPVYMTGGGVREYSKGKIYTSNEYGCITSNSGNHFHSWDVVEKDEYFKPLDQVRYVHTEATPEVENLFENYPGKREGERNNMEAVIYFSNISVEEQDTAFTAHTYKYPKDITEISDYMIPSSFIEFMGLETARQEKVNQFKEITDSIASLLQYKNEKYGNSALEPLEIFGGKCKVGTRIDDKLARIKNSKELLKNDISDLIGYAVLICKENGWTNFDEFKD